MVSESQKRAAVKWDKANTRTLSCKARTETADAFRAYCSAQGKSVHAVLLDYVSRCIKDTPIQTDESPE